MNIFVTGTDTDAGKTVITAGLAASIINAGYTVGVFKPVQTGSVKINHKLISPDLEFVKSTDPKILTHASYNFLEPVAPMLAADLNGVEIDTDKIIDEYKELAKKCDYVIVEGAGGILTPIKENFSMRNLAKVLSLPIVIVARPNLGTINHTLLTIEAAKSQNIDIAGIIISNYPEGTEDIAVKNAPAIIKKLSGEKLLGVLPKMKDLDKNPPVLKDVFSRHVNIDFILKK